MAARRVFIAAGAEATTRRIAEEAGVSQAVLFQRYRTKRQLFFAAMLPRAPNLDELLGPPPPSGTDQAITDLIEIAGRLGRWIASAMPGALRAALHPDFADMLNEMHAPEDQPLLVDALAARLTLLQDRGDLPREPAAQAATTLLELVHGQALTAMLAGNIGGGPQGARRAVLALWRPAA